MCLVFNRSPAKIQRFYQQALDYQKRYKTLRWFNRPESKLRGACWHATKERFNLAEDVRMPRRYWDLPTQACGFDVWLYMSYRDFRWRFVRRFRRWLE